NTIAAALFACKIYQIDEHHPNNFDEQKEKKFDIHAAKIIDKCFDEDEDFSLEILTTKSNFNYTPLELAKQINSRPFIETKCFQKYLDFQWYGSTNYKHTLKFGFQLLLLWVFPLLVLTPIGNQILPSRNDENSFVLLVDYFPYNNNGGRRNGFSIGIPITEIFLHICLWGLILEELREV
ncbi:unnamed protein product, partial [Didymodactylos carnosus]